MMSEAKREHVFFLPEMGEGVEYVIVDRWLVDNKSTVVEDQPVLEVSTDKVTFELCAHRAGIITTAYPLGIHAAPGYPLFRIDDPEKELTIDEKIERFHDLDPDEQEKALIIKLPRI